MSLKYVVSCQTHDIYRHSCWFTGGQAEIINIYSLFQREELKDKYCNGSWANLNKVLTTTDVNTNLVGGYYPEPEIVPQGLVGAFTNTDTPLFEYDAETIVRTVIEGQFLSKTNHINKTGIEWTEGCKMVVVGGGSVNDTLLQTICDIFNIPVYRSNSTNMAALGGAYLGFLANNSRDTLERKLRDIEQLTLVCTPNIGNVKKYKSMLVKYQDMENKLLKG